MTSCWPGCQHGVGVEHLQPECCRARLAVPQPGHRPDLPGPGDPHPDRGRRIGVEQHGGGVPAHRGHGAHQARAVQHGLIRLEAVRAASVDRDRVLVGRARRDHVRRHDPVPAAPGKLQQLLQLGRVGLAEPRLAQLAAKLDHLALQRADGGLGVRRGADVAEKGGHRLGHAAGHALRGPEEQPAERAQPTNGAGRGVTRVDRDQRQRGDEEHGENQPGPPCVVHRFSSFMPLAFIAAARPLRVSAWTLAQAPDGACRSPPRTCRCRAPQNRAGCRRGEWACRSPRAGARRARAGARRRR